MEQAAQSCNWWLLCVLPWTRTAAQKAALELLQFSRWDFAVPWPFQVPWDTVSDTAVIQSVSSGCQVRSVTCRSEGEKSPGRINCFSPTLRYSCPWQLHFDGVRTERHGLPPHPCSAALDFEIYCRWKKYRENCIHCILISSCELGKYWILQEKHWKTLLCIDKSCEKENTFAKPNVKKITTMLPG